MFFEPKTLIVVYKDELMLNQLRKLIETNDDTSDGETVGVTDKSVRIVAWTEKVWKDQKKAGNINNKVLFLGNVADSEKLIPIIDKKYDENGIIYGWAGNQALISVSPKVLNKQELYDEFIKQLSAYSLPDQLKSAPTEKKRNSFKEFVAEDKSKVSDDKGTKKKIGLAGFVGKAIKLTGEIAESVADGAKNAVSEIDSAIDDLPADRSLMAKQQLFYGIMKLYEKDLEEFIQS